MNLKVTLSRLKSASVKRMYFDAKQVHAEYPQKSTLWVFFDMAFSYFKYDVGYLDYLMFGFAELDDKQRRTYMTMKDNLHFARTYNNPDTVKMVENKTTFMEFFKELVGREFINIENKNAEELKDFCNGKDKIFVKQPESFGGLGVRKIDITAETDFEKLYRELTDNKFYHIEEALEQHPEMSVLYPRSINTIRITTTIHDGKSKVMYALVRMGNGKEVDNATSGGMYAHIRPDGTLSKLAFCDKAASYYEKHPISGTVFDGYKIPYIEEAKALCLKAAAMIPDMGYIGWDIAVTPNGPVLVEGNNIPGYDMPQNHRLLPNTENRTGLLREFKNAFGEE